MFKDATRIKTLIFMEMLLERWTYGRRGSANEIPREIDEEWGDVDDDDDGGIGREFQAEWNSGKNEKNTETLWTKIEKWCVYL